MKTQSKSWSAVAVLVFAMLQIIVLISKPARAAGPWYVASGGNNGNSCLSPAAPCSTINGTIGKASSGDTIYVAEGMYTASSGNEVVLIGKSLILSGGWDSTFTIQSGMSAINGQGARRGITVNSGTTVSIERLIIQNGLSGTGIGGGIYNFGILTVNNSIIGNNGGAQGAGIRNDGILTLNFSTVSGNQITGDGGGGGIINEGTLTLNTSRVIDNTASGNGGGIFNTGSGFLTLNNSTVIGNMSRSAGGGIASSFGTPGITAILNNSTVSGNKAIGMGVGGGIYGAGNLILNNTTVSDNTAGGSGGGLYGTGFILQNSLIANNSTKSGLSPDCVAGLYPDEIIGSAGYNLISNTSGCNFAETTGDLIDMNPQLGELTGVLGYHALLVDSPAINSGNPAGCIGSAGPLITDQRGAARLGFCDIGAYEYTPSGPAIQVVAIEGTPQRTPPSLDFWKPLQVAVLDSIGSPVGNATVTFSAPVSGPSGIFADNGTLTTTAVTNASGNATAATFTANESTGNYTVTATVSGVITPTSFSLANLGWYVAPSGSDTNTCQTPATACATINGALGTSSFAAGDTVLVASGAYTDSTSEVVYLNTNVRLLGGWNTAFTVQGGMSIIDGEWSHRGIYVDSVVTVVVEHFIVQNGFGGDRNFGGGGIANRGILTLTDSAIFNDRTTIESAFHWGGGIYNIGDLSVNNSTVSGNNGGAGYGGVGGGIYNELGFLILQDSAVTDNMADIGGGISNGSLYGYGGVTIMINSTVSGNTANAGGGIFSSSGIPGITASVKLYNVTISNNRALGKGGGGIYDNNASEPLTLKNSIIAGNSSATDGPDCFGIPNSLGYNLIGNSLDCTFNPIVGDLLNIYPGLFPLIGVPGYHPLLMTSPAIDAGNPTGCTDNLGNPLLADQRGIARVERCDIGAYEYDPNNDPFTYIFLPLILK